MTRKDADPGGPCTFTGCGQPGAARILARIGDGDPFQIMNASTDPHSEVFACVTHLAVMLNRFAALLEERHPGMGITTTAWPIQSNDDEPTATTTEPNRADRRRAARQRSSAARTGPGR